MRALSVLLLLSLSLGCAAEEPEDEPTDESSADEINGGKVEPAYPEVGMLRFPSGAFGTGVLIGPRTVLTAGHVAAGNPNVFYYGTPATGVAPHWRNLSSVAVAEIVRHPCYPLGNEAMGKDCPYGKLDVAVVRLEARLPHAARAMESSSLTSFFGLWSNYGGDRCVAVGFGMNAESNTGGTRRSAISIFSDLTTREIRTTWDTGIATSGDSGGPLLCNGKIVGTVRGSADPNQDPKSFERKVEGYIRIDRVHDWAESYRSKWR